MARYQFQEGNKINRGRTSPFKGKRSSGIGEKFCEACSSIYTKDPDSSNKLWLKRRFCSKSCALKGNQRTLGKLLGAENAAWRGGITPLNLAVRSSTPMNEWRKSVFVRDSYTCVQCGATNTKIHADHIEAFAVIMRKHGIDSVQAALVCSDLWRIENGRTLCVPCHKKTDTYAGKVWKLLS